MIGVTQFDEHSLKKQLPLIQFHYQRAGSFFKREPKVVNTPAH